MGGAVMQDRPDRFPPMPLEDWSETKETIHRFLQVVGKIRLGTAPRRNHWWSIPFHLTGRGLTTRPMGSSPIFAIDFDFVDHSLVLTTAQGRRQTFPLAGNTVQSFYDQVLTSLGDLGVEIVIDRPEPFDLSDSIPFAEDARPRQYDSEWANRYWRILSEVNLILEAFAGEFSGKTSPVHHFWHTMDLAVTRFSDRVIDHDAGTDSVTREAYSRQVISSGFWFGDASFPAPAFYSYTSPEPEGLADEPLSPPEAEWLDRGNGHLAILRYDDARNTDDPAATTAAFFESAYLAGAVLAGWDVDRLASPHGTTDPQLRLGL